VLVASSVAIVVCRCGFKTFNPVSLKSEGVKVTSRLVLTEAVKQPGLACRHAALRVGEFEVATSGGIWVAIRGPDSLSHPPQNVLFRDTAQQQPGSQEFHPAYEPELCA
jgi:hypothetical protein